MSVPEGYKTIEEIAVDAKVPLGRVQTAIKELNIAPNIFPPERRRRYYSPGDVNRIKEWLESR